MDDEIPKHHSKKNKKKWCRGKSGIEHDPIWILDNRHRYERIVYQCQTCNKEIDIWWDSVGQELWQKGYIKPEIGQRDPKQKKEIKNEDFAD